MRKIDYAWIIVITLGLTSLTTHGFGRFSYSMIIPSMMKGLSLNKAEAGLIQSFHFWGYLISSFIGGFLAAKYSTRLISTLFILLIGLSMIGTGISNSFYTALIMRTLTGIGCGAAYIPAMSLLSIWFKNEQRGLASGLVAIGSCLGMILISQWIPQIVMAHNEEGWRYSWYYLGLVPVVITFIAGSFLRNSPADLIQTKGSKDPAPAIDPLPFGTNPANKGNKRKIPAFQWGRVFSNKTFWHLGLIYAAFGFSYVIMATFFPVYLSSQRNLPISYYSQLFFIMAVSNLASGIFWGRVSDYLGRRNTLIIAFLLMSSSYLVIIFTQSKIGDYIGIMVYGFGTWAIPTIMIAAIGDYAGSVLASSALGFITLIFGIGQALGPWLAGGLAESSDSFIPSFYLAAAIGLLGVIILLFLKKPVPQKVSS
ncbi:MAG: MFS transporter [Candidatus Tectomicrobia bacterium]|uniref:MFS transporter n=1 Tax=Tectimicrobiota bacterium TaxID=2528274 RepID=A0A933GK09_UNCTE|nr:MFS transporter [Candidatus Tectomicrobia bacterium]